MVDLTATTYALVGAAAGTSYVFFSNVGLTQVGTMALLNGRIADIKLSPADKVMAWSGYFFSTARWSLGGTFLSLLLDIYVNRTHSSPLVAKLSLASGLIGATVVPYTITFLADTNRQLIAMSADNAASVRGESEEKSAAVGARVDELLKEWERKHVVRYVAFVGAWGLAMAALVLDGRT